MNDATLPAKLAGRVLVVEDSRTQAAAIAATLRGAGLEVEVARDGVEGLDAARNGSFDLVLSDVQMPNMNGYALTRALKAGEATARLPVILLTTLDQPQDVLEGLASGADNFLSKPFDSEVLLARIARLFERSSSGFETGPAERGSVRFFGRDIDLDLKADHAVEYLSATFEDYLRIRARERQATAEAMHAKRGEAFLQSVLDGVSSCVGILDSDGTLVATNEEWRAFKGRNPLVGPEKEHGTDFLGLCRSWASDHRCARELAEDLPRLLDGSRAETHVECQPHCADEWRCFRVRASRLGTDYPSRIVMSFHDITELKLAEERLQYEAYHDPLTGLPNRALFSERLDRAWARSQRSELPVAVLFLDLDRFKIVNDSLGHNAGDVLLVEIARRISACVRDQDTAARLGGDEFGVLLEGLEEARGVFPVAHRLQAELSRPIMIDGHEVFTTVSIGIAVGQAPDGDTSALVRNADTAMYRAKSTGRARFVLFDEQMHQGALEQLKLSTDLRKALDRDEFFLEYQPLIRLSDRRVTGVEALVRWQHPDEGIVPPYRFISLAEETGLIHELGRFVLREACAQVARWTEQVPGGFPFRVHVNLSGRQFGAAGFADEVKSTLAEFGVSASSLEFELTESVVLATGLEVERAVQALRGLGAGLSMDDFGTGYSSLSALRALPFTTLKLDRSFVGTMDVDPQSEAIVGSLVALAHGMGLKVVAEGVERSEQLDMLAALGCEEVQGYLFARPLAPERAGAMLGETICIAPPADEPEDPAEQDS